MTVFSELGATLRAFDFIQLLLAFLFLNSYAIVLGELFGPLGRLRAAAFALAAAAGFVALTDPWMHGVLLVVAAVAGIGMFIVAVWALSLLAERIAQRAMVLRVETADSLSAISLSPHLHDPEPAPASNSVTPPLRAPRRAHST
jgi:hypothetical protein